jgi:hypothetical protein
MNQINITNCQKITKYILMGLVVICAITYIPQCRLNTMEILMIGATSSISFALLDMIAPTIVIKAKPKEDGVIE